MCTLAKMHFDAFKKCQRPRGVGGHREAQTIKNAGGGGGAAIARLIPPYIYTHVKIIFRGWGYTLPYLAQRKYFLGEGVHPPPDFFLQVNWGAVFRGGGTPSSIRGSSEPMALSIHAQFRESFQIPQILPNSFKLIRESCLIPNASLAPYISFENLSNSKTSSLAPESNVEHSS
jgi:hypothetical protein